VLWFDINLAYDLLLHQYSIEEMVIAINYPEMKFEVKITILI